MLLFHRLNGKAQTTDPSQSRDKPAQKRDPALQKASKVSTFPTRPNIAIFIISKKCDSVKRNRAAGAFSAIYTKLFRFPRQQIARRCRKTKKDPVQCTRSMAAGEGFEPSQTESESVVLPLHNPAICFADEDYYTQSFRESQLLISKNPKKIAQFFLTLSGNFYRSVCGNHAAYKL